MLGSNQRLKKETEPVFFVGVVLIRGEKVQLTEDLNFMTSCLDVVDDESTDAGGQSVLSHWTQKHNHLQRRHVVCKSLKTKVILDAERSAQNLSRVHDVEFPPHHTYILYTYRFVAFMVMQWCKAGQSIEGRGRYPFLIPRHT